MPTLRHLGMVHVNLGIPLSAHDKHRKARDKSRISWRVLDFRLDDAFIATLGVGGSSLPNKASDVRRVCR